MNYAKRYQHWGEMANSLPLKPTMHRATSVFTFLTSLGSGAIKSSMKTRMAGGGVSYVIAILGR